MQTKSVPGNTNLQVPIPTRYRGAIWTLLILAPVISEVLSGSTRLSILFVLIPEVMVWGGAANSSGAGVLAQPAFCCSASPSPSQKSSSFSRHRSRRCLSRAPMPHMVAI
jgi:hypothetical protein